MLVKGLIKSINFSDNSCRVRIPVFETAASQGEVVLDAIMLIQPGMYNGYAEGDVVFIDFENDRLNQPVVIGKLFLGAAKESSTPSHGALAVSNLKVSSKATLPIDTQLVLENKNAPLDVDNGVNSYKSITDIIKALYKTESTVAKVSKDQSDTITDVKVTYLSQPVAQNAPEASDPNWAVSTPEPKNDYAIWQKTTYYNYRKQILKSEISCLTSLAYFDTPRITYYALIHNKYSLEGTIAAPIDGNNLEVKKIEVDSATNEPILSSLPRLDQATTPAEKAEAETYGEWSTTPPAHTDDTNGWNFWTTTETRSPKGESIFSIPIIDQALSDIYALAQGKTTNYYSSEDPSSKYTIKEGDCWFYSSDTNSTLYQWVGNSVTGHWQDVGDELITNKVTTNYINARDITAKKIEVLDTDNSTLFEADGLSGEHRVQIGGFEVEKNTLTTGSGINLIKLDSDVTDSYGVRTVGSTELRNTTWTYPDWPIRTDAFIQTSTLKEIEYNNTKISNLFEFSATNDLDFSAQINQYYAVTKVMFKTDLPEFTLYLARQADVTQTTSAARNDRNDYILASTLNPTGGIPNSHASQAIRGSTYDIPINEITKVTYTNIKANDYFYIVYIHGSEYNNAYLKGTFYIPTAPSVRLTIGDKFQVLADGTVYAKSLYLGKNISDSSTISPDIFGDFTADDWEDAGKLEAKQIEVTAGTGTSAETIFKADGTDAENPMVQLGGNGGWIVGKDGPGNTTSIYADQNVSEINPLIHRAEQTSTRGLHLALHFSDGYMDVFIHPIQGSGFKVELESGPAVLSCTKYLWYNGNFTDFGVDVVSSGFWVKEWDKSFETWPGTNEVLDSSICYATDNSSSDVRAWFQYSTYLWDLTFNNSYEEVLIQNYRWNSEKENWEEKQHTSISLKSETYPAQYIAKTYGTGVNLGWVVRNSSGHNLLGYGNHMPFNRTMYFEYAMQDGNIIQCQNYCYIDNVLNIENKNNFSIGTGYVFYYMSQQGFRFRICGVNDFNAVYMTPKEDTQGGISYLFDFDIFQLSRIQPGAGGGSNDYIL